MSRRLSLTVAAVAVALTMGGGPAAAQMAPAGPATTPAQQAANKKVVLDFIREVFEAQNLDNADRFIAKDFIQRKPGAPSGLDGFKAWFGPRFKPKPVEATLKSPIVEVLAERDLVFLMLKHQHPHPEAPGQNYDSYWFDLFRVRDGKIVEHWDQALWPKPKPAPAP